MHNCPIVLLESAQGQYDVPFFTAKARAVAQIKRQHPSLPVTVIQLAYFYTNLLERFRPKKVQQANVILCSPVCNDDAHV